ncbi:potassium transporter TrkA [Halomarina litorea]|uniref:potassium transporter TrkA n=1 Tax=Halomarina litorea TaxID=2961595 RepID=UPI0020C29BE8|nr:potassium transporter TrkA [Halomarina sp. BCD28]
MSVLQSTPLAETLLVQGVRVLGIALLSGATAGVVGVLHRGYARSRIPEGLAVLAGVSAVALVLNTSAVLEGVINEPGAGTPEAGAMLANVVTFLAAGLAASAGGRAGDGVGHSLFSEGPDVRRIVDTVGRQVTVTLPETLATIEDHDPIPPETNERLAGASLSFPRRLTVEELHDRLVARLKTDYGVGYVDLELADDGTVEYLAVGGRVAGLGPTLPPGTTAVAVRADPAGTASPGDLVQVWDEGPELVTTAELRGVAGDVVTLAVDEGDATDLSHTTTYRLLTLPSQARNDREFAALFRAAEETMAVVTVAEGSALDGMAVGALSPTVVAIRVDGASSVEPTPSRTRTLAAGETLYVIGRPAVLRRLEAAAAGDGTPPTVEPTPGD